MTYRERKEARLERRLEWAEKREGRAAVVAKEAEKYHGDVAFNTQPGHIPERARLIRRQDRAYQDLQVAEHHRSTAAGIERQLETSIFSDDHDAIERLEAKIAELEATRDARKRANKAFKRGGVEELRKEVGDEMALEGLETMRICPWHKAPFPSYSLTNLSGNLNRTKKRLEQLKAQRADEAAGIPSAPRPNKYATKCAGCGIEIAPWQGRVWKINGEWIGAHYGCNVTKEDA